MINKSHQEFITACDDLSDSIAALGGLMEGVGSHVQDVLGIIRIIEAKMSMTKTSLSTYIANCDNAQCKERCQ